MKRIDIEKWLVKHGYQKDKFGHYKRSDAMGIIRAKLSKISIRVERQILVIDHHEWSLITSGYYKNLWLNDDDKICGFNLRKR